jgi:hypothetical protein
MTKKTEIILSAKDETKAAIKSAMDGLDKLKSYSVGVSTVLGGLGSAITVAGFANLISSTISFAAALDDMAEATGASVENLSALSSVAKVGGHDIGTVEAGLMKLSKALHASDEVSKGAGKAIEALGLNLQELRGLDTAEAMLRIAKAFDQFKEGSGKSAVATAIFKGEAAALLPYLKDLAEQTELVGKVTAEQAALAEQYEKNIKKLTISFGALAKEASFALVPALASVTGEMVAGLQASGGWIGYLKNLLSLKTTSSLPDQLKEINAEAAKLEDRLSVGRGKKGDDERLDSLKKQQRFLVAIDDQRKKTMAEGLGANDIVQKKSLDDFVGKGGKPDKEKKSQIDEALRLIQSLDEQIALKAADAESTDKMTAAEQQAIKVRYQLKAETLKATDAQQQTIFARLESLAVLERELLKQKEFTDALSKQEESNVKSRQSMIEQALAAERQAETYGLSESAISAMTQARLADALAITSQNAEMAEQTAALEEELDLREKVTAALEKSELARLLAQTDSAKKAKSDADRALLDKALESGDISPEKHKEAIAALKADLTELDEFSVQAARNIQSAFADFLFDPFADSAENMLKKFADIVRRMAAEALAAEVMKNLFGTMGKGGGDWGWVGQAASAIAAFEDGGIMTSAGAVPLRKYAGGGVANSPQLAMFGEGSTPEAYVPLPDGRRIPVAMSGGQQAAPQQNIRIVNAFDNSVIGDYLGSAAGERIIMNAVQRNAGAFRQAMA